MYCINYVIRPGDTLYSISRQYNVSVEELMRANPMVNVYRLLVDDVLCIPVSVPQNNATNFTSYTVQEGDTLGTILNNNHINLADLMQLNDLNQIYVVPGTTLSIPNVSEGEPDYSLEDVTL